MRTLLGPVARSLSIALLMFAALSPTILHADDSLEGLKKEERSYVTRLNTAYATALGVTADIDEMLAGGSFEAAFGGGSLEPSVVVAALATANSLLAESAATLLEAPPTSMAGLRSTNEQVAAVLNDGYAPCEGATSEASGRKALEWGRGVMEDLFGVAPDAEASDAASASRVISCIAGRNQEIKDAVRESQSSLHERIEEIQREDKLERDLFGDIVGAECFIATAAYGTESAQEIQVLRDFRDDVLMRSEAGRDYVNFYYAVSPPVADYIAEREWLRTYVRELAIDPIVRLTNVTMRYWRTT